MKEIEVAAAGAAAAVMVVVIGTAAKATAVSATMVVSAVPRQGHLASIVYAEHSRLRERFERRLRDVL